MSGPNLTALTGAVDFHTIVTAVLAVSVAGVSAVIAWVGVRMVWCAISGQSYWATDWIDGEKDDGLEYWEREDYYGSEREAQDMSDWRDEQLEEDGEGW
jgi:hypothetical protein